MKKKLGFSLMMLTLCTSIFIGGCSCSNEPTNPNAKVILANEIALDKNLITDAQIGVPISITYTIRPSNTTDKTIVVSSSDETVATVNKSEVTDTLSDTIVVTPVGVGTVSIVFTWTGTFDNDYDKEDRTLKKATTIHVVGEYGKDTLNTPTGLNYANGKFTWNKVGYGTDGVVAEPSYELTLTGGASPTTPVTLTTNEYEFALTAGVTYTAKVKAKPADDMQYFYTASAYTEEIELYKLPSVESYSVNSGVVTWDVVDGATKYVVNINGEDVETIDAPTTGTTVSFDTNSYFSDEVTQVVLKVKAINDTDSLIFNGEYSANSVTINKIGKTSNYTLTQRGTSTILSWDTVEYATNYVLKITKVGETVPVVNEILTENSYILNSSFDGSYNVQVQAIGDEYTLDGEFTDSYQFTTLDIDNLTATLSNGVVTYSATNLNGNTIVFKIINNDDTIVIEATEDGSFDLSEYIDTNTYIVTAQLVPASGSNFVVSALKVVGFKYDVSLTNENDYTSNLVWDKISNANTYTLEILTDTSTETYENIANVVSGKVKFELPQDLASGVHKARIKVVSNDNLVTTFGEYFTFVKLDANDISTTFTNNVLKVTTTNSNIKTIVVYINEIDDKFELKNDDELDFATLGLTTGTYTVSIQALADTNVAYSNSDIILTSHKANVIKNPEISGITADGKLSWNTDTNYGTYKIYIDNGEASEQVLDATTNEITLLSLTEGEHKAYVAVNPINGYLPSSNYFVFTFTKLGLVSSVSVKNNKVTWDSVTGAASYLVVENDKAAVVVNDTSFTPTEIKNKNVYKITPIGNGTNTVTGGFKEVAFLKIATVEDLGVTDGKISFTAIDKVNYKLFVNGEEIPSGVEYTFTGETPYELQEVYVYGTREGYFDSDNSAILKVKKLGAVTNIAVTSTDKYTYNITWDAVLGANNYAVNYMGNTYFVDTNELEVLSEIEAGDYEVTVVARHIGTELVTEGSDTFGYINGDISELYSFTKLAAPTEIRVVDGVLTWENENETTVTRYDMQYSDDDGESWITKTLDDTLTNDLTFLSSGSYLIKLRSVGTDTNVISSDYSSEEIVTRLEQISGLKVKNGAIVWDAYVSDTSAYVYDVYVYTKSNGVDVLFGEPILNYPRTTFEIPNIAENTEYELEIIVKNAAGIEVPSAISERLKVVKLYAPTNFVISNAVASWDEVKYNGEVVAQNYRLTAQSDGYDDLHFDLPVGIHSKVLDGNFQNKISYDLTVMAYGTTDSEDTMFGYLNSEYSVSREIYRLAEVANLRIEDGSLIWEHTYTSSDKYLPVGYYLIFTSFVADQDGNVTAHESEELLSNTVSSYSLEDIVPGDYRIEIYTMGNGIVSLNSSASVLGDVDKVKKLATPTGLRMQDGVFVWDEHTTDTTVTYVLYNNGVEFLRLSGETKSFNPDVEVTTVFNITIQTVMEGAIYSDISEQITIYKLPKVTNFVIDDGKFKWTKVENATGYTIMLQYEGVVVDPDTGETMIDPETGLEMTEAKNEKIVVNGGDTTEISIPESLPRQYTVSEVYANGNTTSDHSTTGYFKSVAITSNVNFTPLDEPKNVTVKNGTFVWDVVTGADYYALEIFDSSENIVKKVNVTTNYYELTDDALVPAGTYTLRVTPISKSDKYLTTNISTEIKFSKLEELKNVRIENGYLAWSVLKSDILEAYKIKTEDETPPTEGEEEFIPSDDELYPEEGGENEGEEDKYNDDIFNEFYSVAVGPYVDNENTAKFYSLAYANITLTNTANNKIVTKTIQPFNVVDGGENDNFVTCYYFVDVEEDTWKISISAEGNTVKPEDQTSIKYVDGVKPSTFITASKLSKPVCPVHYDSTAIIDGKLVFTPIKTADGVLYEKYIIEAVPATLPTQQILTRVITVTGETSFTYDLKNFGFIYDIPYNISIKTYGTELGTTGDLYLNSNTPMTTSLIMLGQPILTVTKGDVTWGAVQADYFLLTLRNEDGSINEVHELSYDTNKFELGSNYPVDTYYITVQAIGDGINKISSTVSKEIVVTKLGVIQEDRNQNAIVLNQGSFEWQNVNAQNGYVVQVIGQRDGTNGKVNNLVNIELTQVEETSVVSFEIPSDLPSYTVEDGTQYYWKYSIKVKLLGSTDGKEDLKVSGEFSAESYSYQKLNTPSNIRVEDGIVMWNDVAGATGYQVLVNGTVAEGESETYESNVGSQVTFTLPNRFGPGVYNIKVRALGGTPSLSSPTVGYLTGSYSQELVIVRVAEPVLRVERGEVMWTSVEGLPFEATASVKINISGKETIKDNIEDNAGFDFDNEEYPAGNYQISVQFIGNNQLINGMPETGLEDWQQGGEPLDFYYLGSNPRSATYTKLETPTITLTKVEFVVDEESGLTEEKNAIGWQSITNATGYDVYIVTEREVIVTPDDLQTEDIDESVTNIIRNVEVYRFDQPENSELFGTNENGNYFLLKDVEHEEFKVYIRAVGDDVRYISSTRSNEIHIQIPIAPTEFEYIDETGTISWNNITVSSDIVLDIRKYNENTYEYEQVQIYENGQPVEQLKAGTTSYKLTEIGDYQVRIKARLTYDNGSYDSDFNENTLNISFRLFNSGDGSTSNPYIVTKEDELNNIRYFLDRNFVITNNITLNAYTNWTIVGNSNEPFTGTIRGNGYTVSGIKYENEINTNIAFIHTISSTASISGLNLEITVDCDSYRTRTANYAGIAIMNYGTITNCDITGNIKVNGNAVSTTLYAGAVVENYGTIDNVINYSNITALRNTNNTNYATRVGGVVAKNYGTVTKSGNEGNLYGQDVGGVACYNYSDINNCYNTGGLKIVSNGYTEFNLKLGGIAAYNTTSSYYVDKDQIVNCVGTIDTCYTILLDGQIEAENSSGKAAYIGGIVGNNTVEQVGCIANCYAMVGEYTIPGTDVVATLAGNISSYAVSTYYNVFNNCYSYSTTATLFAAGHDNKITTLNANHKNKITKVATIDAGIIDITGITINEANGYMPKFSWQ